MNSDLFWVIIVFDPKYERWMPVRIGGNNKYPTKTFSDGDTAWAWTITDPAIDEILAKGHLRIVKLKYIRNAEIRSQDIVSEYKNTIMEERIQKARKIQMVGEDRKSDSLDIVTVKDLKKVQGLGDLKQ